jgi:ribosomal RNA-processing protein 9
VSPLYSTARTCADVRSLSLWHTGKKKPIFTQAFAHGIEETPRWITSIAHLRGSDLFVSGACGLHNLTRQ